MPLPIAVPIVGGLALAAGAFFHFRKKIPPAVAAAAVQGAPPLQSATRTNPAPGPAPAPSPLPGITINPDGTAHAPATPFVFDTNAAAAAAVAEANRLGVSVNQLLQQQAAAAAAPPATGAGQTASVSTNDPAPSGDLIIRSGPSLTAPQIGGAEKNGVVTILDATDPTFAKIVWPGGARLPAATGFAKKQFLKLL